jgi:hypothetical protein
MSNKYQPYPAWRYKGAPDDYEARIIESADSEESGWEDSPAKLSVKDEQPASSEATKADLLQVAEEQGVTVDKRWGKAKIAAALEVEI